MYAQRLVGVIEAHCAGATMEDKTMRTIGAVVFKNLIKAKWAPEVSGGIVWVGVRGWEEGCFGQLLRYRW